MIGAIDHLAFNVSNVEKMLQFYTEVLGFAAEQLEEYRVGKVRFPSVRVGAASVINFFPPEMWQKGDQASTQESRLDHFCLAVSEEDWHNLRTRLEKYHIPIHRGPVELWGAHGFGTSIFIYDPEMNQIEIRYYKSKGVET